MRWSIMGSAITRGGTFLVTTAQSGEFTFFVVATTRLGGMRICQVATTRLGSLRISAKTTAFCNT